MMLKNLAVFAQRYPKIIVLVWTLFLICFGFYAFKLPTALKDHGLLPRGAYIQVEKLLAAHFHIPKDPVILVFEKNPSVSEAEFRPFIQQALQRLQGIEGLYEIVSPLERAGMINGDLAYALLAVQGEARGSAYIIDAIRGLLPDHAGITVKLTGKPVVQADVNQASRYDLGKAERIGIPAAFIILWLAFGGIVSALLPIVIGLIGVGGTMGIMYGLGTRMELSNFVLNVIPMVGLALSIDFALMMVSRFREELQRESAEQALQTAMMTAGRAVLFSAASVFLGLFGIRFIPLPMFSSIAIGAMIVLTVSVMLTLTLLPALLSLLWPVIKRERRPNSPHPDESRTLWFKLPRFALTRPFRTLLAVSCLLLICCLPVYQMKLAVPDATSLPHSYASRAAFEAIQTHFGSRTSSDIVVIAHSKSAGFQQEDWHQAALLLQQLQTDPKVERIDSVFSILPANTGTKQLEQLEQLGRLVNNPVFKAKYEPLLRQFVQGSKMLFHVRLEGEQSSAEVMQWLRDWEQKGAEAKLPFLLGGEAKYQQEVYDAIFNNMTRVLLFIFASNYIVLFLAFRSLLIPLKTILMNFLSLGAAFGILVWIFEQGRLGMEPGSIAIMIPVFIFGLVFGISMDYGVFLLSRIYETYRLSQNNRHAVLSGLASVSAMINSAAAIMIAVTLPFAFAEVSGVRQLGVGIAAAIFIDATIIRMLLVPALMILLGKWNWWVPRLFRP